MRLTKKEFRKIMAEVLNEYGIATPAVQGSQVAPVPPAAMGESPEGAMWNAWYDMRVPKAWGSENWPQYLEGPQGTVGWKLEADPGVQGGMHLAIIVPAEATELAGMFKSTDREFHYVATGLPATGGSHVDSARFKQILSWLQQNWPAGKNDKIEIPRQLMHGTPEYAKSHEIDPNAPIYENKLDRNALRQMILQEMRMAPTHAGAIEMMKANPDETVIFEPEDPTDAPTPGMGMPAQGTYSHLDRMALEQELASHGLQNLPPEMSDEKLASLLQALGGPVMLQEKRTRRHLLREMEEAPPAAAVADAVEQVRDPGLLARIWSIIQAMGDDFGKTTSTGEFPSGYEVAQAQMRAGSLSETRRTRRRLLREMEETPPAAVIANEVEQIADQGLLIKIWNMIKQTVDPPPMTPEEKARAQEEFSAMLRARKEAMANPQTMGDKFNKWLSGIPEEAFSDISTTSEGFEPGGYRYEGDRRLSEVSIGTGRWNLLAGTDEK